ncbi:MAG: Rpn family recombination-promoting nuclease/putative transposase [Planctomycetaceae bacterium]|nr:Rpn family recombination-promoting nuclease/putative transposase [Planctomycetaceae bacterium]
MTQNQTGERVLISFDYALKRLLRNKVNYDVLEGFLSELLKTDISVKNIGESESNKEHVGDKYNRVDILVEDKNGVIMLIELQFTQEIDYLHRMLFGTSKAITERMTRGSKYREVKKIYSINIVYFDLGEGEDYVYHGKTHFTGLHTNDELHLSKAQHAMFGKEMAGDIYPEYYILRVNKFDDKTRDRLDEWIYFFKHTVIKDEFQAKGLGKARNILDRDKLPPEEQKDYDYVQQRRIDDEVAIESARLEGREEGRIEREKIAKERDKFAEAFEKERKKREKEVKKREKEIEKEREKREKEVEKREEEFEKEREELLAEIARLKRNQ